MCAYNYVCVFATICGNNVGVQITVSVLITKPHIKHMQEGGSGTIAACFQATSVGDTNSLTPVFRNDIKWLWMNATNAIQLPNNNINSNVWSNGYILRAADVSQSNSGNYCCVIGDTESCAENAITQLIVSGYQIYIASCCA